MSQNPGGPATSRPAAADSIDIDGVLQRAESAMEDALISVALADFRRVIALRPKHPRAHLGAGRCLQEMIMLRPALEHFVVAAQSGQVWPLMQFAAACRKDGHLEIAEQAYRHAATFWPDRAQIYDALAAIAQTRGHRAEAAALQKQANAVRNAPPKPPAPVLEAAPKQPKIELPPAAPLLQEAEQLRKAGRHEDALSIFERVLADRPRNLPAHLGAGRCLMDAGNPQAALPHLIEAAREGNHAKAVLNASGACARAGNPQAAEAGFRRAVELLPDQPEALRGLAACLRARGDIAESVVLQKRACALAPADTRARIELARDLRALRLFDEATSIVDGLLAEQPALTPALRLAAAIARDRAGGKAAVPGAGEIESTAATVGRIALLRDDGQTEEALSLARALIARAPDNNAALVQLGLCCRAEEDGPGALDAFRRAHERDPADVTVMLQLVRELRAAGQAEASAALLERALKADEQGTQAMAFRAEQALQSNDGATALAYYEAAVGRAPSQLPLYLGAASALSRLGRATEALGWLERAPAQGDALAAIFVKRAQLLRQAGRFAEALAACEEGLARFAQHFPLWELSLRLRALTGDEAASQAMLAAPASRSLEEDAMVAGLAGDLALDRGDAVAARSAYRKAAALQPADPAYQGDLARACLTGFDLTGATTYLHEMSALQAAPGRRRGRASGSAQTFLGAILDEYKIDAEARAAFAALPAEPRLRVDALLGLCADYPDNTLLAAGLVDALWGSSLLGHIAPGAAAIPDRIIQYWDEAVPPADIDDLMTSWRAGRSADAYACYDDRSARQVLAAHFAEDVVFAYHRAVTLSAKSDLFRFACLAATGGIYADAFDRRLGAVADLVPSGVSLVLYRGELGLISNGFMAAAPDHPMLRYAVADAAKSINRGDKDLLWLSTGPGLATRSFAQFLAADPKTLKDRLAATKIWSRHEMTRSVALQCLADWKSTIPPRATMFTKRAYRVGGVEGD